MRVTVRDAAKTVLDLLKNSWNAVNAGVHPDDKSIVIDYSFNRKRLSTGRAFSTVWVYEGKTAVRSHIGRTSRKTETPVTIDVIRQQKANETYEAARTAFLKIVSEVDRIMNAQNITPGNSYDIVEDGGWTDFTNPSTGDYGIHRMVYEVTLVTLVEDRPS